MIPSRLLLFFFFFFFKQKTAYEMRISDWSSDVCSSDLPHELHLHLESDRGTTFACRECGRSCKAHDFGEFRWRHLNFFQHHCYITARVPRTDCPEHGVKRLRYPGRGGADRKSTRLKSSH